MADTSPHFVWRAHPAREKPVRAAIGLGVVAAFGALVGVWCVMDGLPASIAAVIGAAASGVLILALHRFFFPSRFEIDSDGITARYFLKTQHLEWRHIRRFLHDQFGGYLSTRAQRSRLDGWKGMHILFGAARVGAVGRIRAHLPEDVRASSNSVAGDATEAEAAPDPRSTSHREPARR